MLLIKNTLPKFLKTIILATAATISMSAFAGDLQTKDLKDFSTDNSSIPEIEATELSAEEAEAAAKAKAEMKEPLDQVPHE